jgi:hypothetical protein
MPKTYNYDSIGEEIDIEKTLASSEEEERSVIMSAKMTAMG